MGKKLTAQDKWDRAYKIAELIHASMDGIKRANLHLSEDHMDWYAFEVAQLIYGQPDEVTNYMSKKLLEALDSGSGKVCYEHYFGRKASGRLIIKKVLAGHSIARIAAIIRSRSRVNRVTSAENTRLKKFSSSMDLLKTKAQIQHEYNCAGIELVYVTPKITMYIIDGIEYSKDEAMEKFDIDYGKLYSRCNSTAKRGKYTTWLMKENQ